MKKVIAVVLLFVLAIGCSSISFLKTKIDHKDVILSMDSSSTGQTKDEQVVDTSNRLNNLSNKYSEDDIKTLFDGQNNGFKYYYEGINQDTKRYMVSTDAEGHAASYHYEINLMTGEIYNDKNQVIDSLEDMMKSVKK